MYCTTATAAAAASVASLGRRRRREDTQGIRALVTRHALVVAVDPAETILLRDMQVSGGLVAMDSHLQYHSGGSLSSSRPDSTTRTTTRLPTNLIIVIVFAFVLEEKHIDLDAIITIS